MSKPVLLISDTFGPLRTSASIKGNYIFSVTQIKNLTVIFDLSLFYTAASPLGLPFNSTIGIHAKSDLFSIFPVLTTLGRHLFTLLDLENFSILCNNNLLSNIFIEDFIYLSTYLYLQI